MTVIEQARKYDSDLGVAQRWIESLQSQLAWAPVSAVLPTEEGHYEFALITCGKLRLFDLWKKDQRCWVHFVTYQAQTSPASRFNSPLEHWEYTHYRRVELPKEGAT